MYYSNVTCAEAIKEFLIANQAVIKQDIYDLTKKKKEWLSSISDVYRDDIDNQYQARIRQHIAFLCASSLALPAEYVVVEIEKIDLEKYLNV
jgi:hypothetical protein